MRFLAKFIDPISIDADRRFIVTYFLNNDTISIFEKFERNSGFVGGKFLERSRVTNPATNQYFKSTDLYVSAELNINKHFFQLLDADEWTRKYMAKNPHVFTVQNGPPLEGMGSTSQIPQEAPMAASQQAQPPMSASQMQPQMQPQMSASQQMQPQMQPQMSASQQMQPQM